MHLINKLRQNCKTYVRPEEADRVEDLLKKINELWQNQELERLFYLVMAVNLHVFDLEYYSVVKILIKTITPVLYRIQRDWDSID